jgi:cytoskeletal protein CcmA (bactofilin family)
MFKSTNNQSMSKSPENNSPEKLNRIVDGTSIEGHIKSDSNIRIDGKLKGTIQTRGRLVIGSSGFIDGDIVCENADIEGTFSGKIQVNGLLTLKSSAKLKGEIITGKLAIEPGAVFSGSCAMSGGNKEPLNDQSPIEKKLGNTTPQTA